MLKQYSWNGSTWQFEENQAPADAVEIIPVSEKKVVSQNKTAQPENKAIVAKTKPKGTKK